jgi:hypothetical protein
LFARAVVEGAAEIGQAQRLQLTRVCGIYRWSNAYVLGTGEYHERRSWWQALKAPHAGQAHLRFPQFNILLAFWLDTELLLIKIATPLFAAILNRGVELFLATFEGSSLSGVAANLRAK